MSKRNGIPKAPQASEAEISKGIMDLLAAKHIFALRMNSGKRFGVTNGHKWAIHMHAPGTADILAFPRLAKVDITRSCAGATYHVPGVVWIEVKDATGKQSELQKSFQAQVETEGHRYILARSIEDVEEALR